MEPNIWEPDAVLREWKNKLMELVNDTINNLKKEKINKFKKNYQINHLRGTSSFETIFIKTSLWHINYQVVVAQIDKINEILYLFVKRSYTAVLIKEINFAKEITDISREDIQVTYHVRKSLLFSNEKPWMKREGNFFDVTMGVYDGAEVCELVDIFMLNKIRKKYNKNDMGLYRDDGVAVFRNTTGSESERIKKNFKIT